MLHKELFHNEEHEFDEIFHDMIQYVEKNEKTAIKKRQNSRN
jgi:hypothetical protein